MFTQGLVMFVVGPLIGWVRDYTQNFLLTFSLLTMAMIACAVAWLMEMVFVHFRNGREIQPNSIEESGRTTMLTTGGETLLMK